MPPETDDPSARDPHHRRLAELLAGFVPTPTESTSAFEQTAKGEREQVETDLKRTRVNAATQTIKLRDKYFFSSFWLVVGWLVVVLAILVCHGDKSNSFSLSDEVVITLLGATTFKVIGIFFIVGRNLFPKQ